MGPGHLPGLRRAGACLLASSSTVGWPRATLRRCLVGQEHLIADELARQLAAKNNLLEYRMQSWRHSVAEQRKPLLHERRKVFSRNDPLLVVQLNV